MASIALIGADGAGKTTMARMLEESSGIRFKYLYMGISLESSNLVLPTSYVFQLWKSRRSRTKSGQPSGEITKSGLRSTIRSALRLVFRISEEWFRQFVSWSYQLRGYTVLYDRHFIFDFFDTERCIRTSRWSDKIHRWFLWNLFPRPSLTFFLDAPAEILMGRKKGTSIEYLNGRQHAFLRAGTHAKNFFRIDATQSLEEIYSEVLECIKDCSDHNDRQSHSSTAKENLAASCSRCRLGSTRWILQLAEAAVIAPARSEQTLSANLHALVKGSSNLNRVAALIVLINKLLPGFASALSRRLYNSKYLPILNSGIELLNYGAGSSVFLIENQGTYRVLKIYRRSLGLPVKEQLKILDQYRSGYETVKEWYDIREPLVPTTEFAIINGPIFGSAVAAAVLPYIKGIKGDLIEDFSAEELGTLFDRNTILRRQFLAFADQTIRQFEAGEKCLDVLGKNNLTLVENDEETRLIIIDTGIFELETVKEKEPQKYSRLATRIAQFRSLVEKLECRKQN